MIAVDTNVLVRLVVNDDAALAARARALFDAQADRDDAIWLADVVVAELVWALDRVYGLARADVVGVLRSLSTNSTVQLESDAAVRRAIPLYEAGPADFADCLLAAKAGAAGCEAVRTFDRGMKGLPGVALL